MNTYTFLADNFPARKMNLRQLRDELKTALTLNNNEIQVSFNEQQIVTTRNEQGQETTITNPSALIISVERGTRPQVRQVIQAHDPQRNDDEDGQNEERNRFNQRLENAAVIQNIFARLTVLEG